MPRASHLSRAMKHQKSEHATQIAQLTRRLQAQAHQHAEETNRRQALRAADAEIIQHLRHELYNVKEQLRKAKKPLSLAPNLAFRDVPTRTRAESSAKAASLCVFVASIEEKFKNQLDAECGAKVIAQQRERRLEILLAQQVDTRIAEKELSDLTLERFSLLREEMRICRRQEHLKGEELQKTRERLDNLVSSLKTNMECRICKEVEIDNAICTGCHQFSTCASCMQQLHGEQENPRMECCGKLVGQVDLISLKGLEDLIEKIQSEGMTRVKPAFYCPKSCTEHGICKDEGDDTPDECHCFKGFSGIDCSIVVAVKKSTAPTTSPVSKFISLPSTEGTKIVGVYSTEIRSLGSMQPKVASTMSRPASKFISRPSTKGTKIVGVYSTETRSMTTKQPKYESTTIQPSKLQKYYEPKAAFHEQEDEEPFTPKHDVHPAPIHTGFIALEEASTQPGEKNQVVPYNVEQTMSFHGEEADETSEGIVEYPDDTSAEPLIVDRSTPRSSVSQAYYPSIVGSDLEPRGVDSNGGSVLIYALVGGFIVLIIIVVVWGGFWIYRSITRKLTMDTHILTDNMECGDSRHHTQGITGEPVNEVVREEPHDEAGDHITTNKSGCSVVCSSTVDEIETVQNSDGQSILKPEDRSQTGTELLSALVDYMDNKHSQVITMEGQDELTAGATTAVKATRLMINHQFRL